MKRGSILNPYLSAYLNFVTHINLSLNDYPAFTETMPPSLPPFLFWALLYIRETGNTSGNINHLPSTTRNQHSFAVSNPI